MLRALLRYIAEHPGRSYRELAEDLSAEGYQVDKGLVEMAVRELEQKGYLRREPLQACLPVDSAEGSAGSPACASGCAHCPLRSAGRTATTLVLTDRARSGG